MAHYRRVGDVPGTRHTVFRDAQGALRYEELMGEEGFSSDSSLLYHAGVPSAIVDSQVWELPDLGTTANHPLKPRHLKLHALFPTDGAGTPAAGTNAVEGRRLVLGNGDVRISYVVADDHVAVLPQRGGRRVRLRRGRVRRGGDRLRHAALPHR